MTKHKEQSLQELFAPKSSCFGCGPNNKTGLKIRSLVIGNQTHAFWQPHSNYEAFPNVLSGGIIGTLLDCHSNWTAAWAIMNNLHCTKPPCTVTAEYKIKLLKPCPTNNLIQLKASILKSDLKKASIYAEIIAENTIVATCNGLFIAVKEAHPAYNRW